MKKKKNIGGILLVVILILIIIGLVGYILIDKNIIQFKQEKKEPIEEIVEKITKEEEQKMFELAELVYNDSESLNKEEIENQDKLNIALKLSGKNSFEEVKGKELIDTYHKYFGNDSNIELENIVCPGASVVSETDLHAGDKKYLLLYNNEQDSFHYNPNHLGHGGGMGTKPYLSYKYILDSKIEKRVYKLNVKVYYMQNPCPGDTCINLPSDAKVYKTFNDTKDKENFIVDASVNDKYCTINTFASSLGNNFYDCDYDAIYDGLKDELNTYTFEFIKEKEKLIFTKYYINEV